MTSDGPQPAWLAIAICAFSLCATAVVGGWAWARRHAARPARSFALLAFAEAAWNAGHIAELTSATVQMKVAWDAFQTVPAVLVALLFLIFAADFTGRLLPRWLVLGAGAILLLPTAVIVAAPFTGGLRAGAHVEGPYGALIYPFTGWDLAYMAVVALLATGALALMIAQVARQRLAFRAQALAVAAAMAVPLVTGMLWIALDLRLQGERDISHVSFAVSALVIGWALSRARLFDLVPIAREAVLDGLGDAVLVLDRRACIVDANQAALTLLQHSARSLIGRAAADGLAHWPPLAPLHGEEPRQTDVLSSAAGGRRIYDARWTPLRDGRSGQWLGNTLVLRDVTALREAQRLLEHRVQQGEEELAVSEGRMRALFDQTFQLIGLLDREGRVLTANRAALEMIGADAAAVVGRALWETPWWAHDPQQQQRLREAVSRAAAGEFVRFDATHRDRDGKLRSIDFSLMPVRDARGAVVQIIPEGRDVTALREAQARAQTLTAQLQQAQKMEALGRVAGGVAHDFNNLLSVIGSAVTLAQRDVPAGGHSAEFLEHALQATQSAGNLTRQLLTFSRKQPQLPRRLAVSEALAQIEGVLRRLAGDGVKLETRLAPGLAPVFMDPASLQQVLVNLVVNARDAMPAGGTITIAAEQLAITPDGPAASDRRPGDFVRLAVRDTGQGMSEEVRAHLFEPFFTTKAEGAGTGLGLAVVHGAVVGSGGFIDVRSAPGAGTTFFVHLPVAPADDPRGRAS